jgi:hypothetical protein
MGANVARAATDTRGEQRETPSFFRPEPHTSAAHTRRVPRMHIHIGRRLSYANVAATLALVFSMSGGALAATHYLISSTSQINPKVLKKLKGGSGKAGVNGVAGAPGAAGATGPTGPAGSQGKEGAQGKEGQQGQEGKEGKEGPFVATLPSGKTLTGHYHLELDNVTNAHGDIGQGYSYAFPLASDPTTHFIASGATAPAQCPGSAAEPKALPGNLCVYEGTSNSDVVSFGVETDRHGFGLLMENTGSSSFWSIGSWAVTAP